LGTYFNGKFGKEPFVGFGLLNAEINGGDGGDYPAPERIYGDLISSKSLSLSGSYPAFPYFDFDPDFDLDSDCLSQPGKFPESFKLPHSRKTCYVEILAMVA
jgi:hypothetical protein